MRVRFRGLPGAPRLVTISAAAAACLALAFAAGCQPNDLGSPCNLARPVCYADCDDPENADIRLESFEPEDRLKDYVATGVVDCEHFTCVSSAGYEGTPYCTRPCLDDEQCRGGVNQDLVCRELVLDDQFIADLCEQLGPEECEAVFGQIKGAMYCTTPLSE